MKPPLFSTFVTEINPGPLLLPYTQFTSVRAGKTLDCKTRHFPLRSWPVHLGTNNTKGQADNGVALQESGIDVTTVTLCIYRQCYGPMDKSWTQPQYFHAQSERDFRTNSACTGETFKTARASFDVLSLPLIPEKNFRRLSIVRGRREWEGVPTRLLSVR